MAIKDKKQIDEDRVGKNSQLMKPKKVELSGPQRYFVMRQIERIPNSARVTEERDLYEKVARD